MNWWTSTGFLIRSALPVRSKLAGFAERVFVAEGTGFSVTCLQSTTKLKKVVQSRAEPWFTMLKLQEAASVTWSLFGTLASVPI